ncbi:MAG TPA: hypothetical protein VFR35_09730 [Actinoplanes sp.]|nr:hypothetical protein [Actinoplanes sp.]
MASGPTFTIAGPELSADDLRSLRRWMIDVSDLRGPFDLRQSDPEPGELGSVTDALVVAAGSGGAITALAGVLISWLRHRTADLTVKVTRPDGSTLEVSGTRVRGLDGAALGAEIERLAAQLAAAPPPAVEASETGTADTRA